MGVIPMKKIMYHIHTMGIHDDDWVVGNVIDNRKNYVVDLKKEFF